MVKFLTILAVLAVVVARPVFAQSFDPEAGSGNVLPSYYGQDGVLHAGKIADRNSSLYAFATIPPGGTRRHRQHHL
jgi:hypothetical protein